MEQCISPTDTRFNSNLIKKAFKAREYYAKPASYYAKFSQSGCATIKTVGDFVESAAKPLTPLQRQILSEREKGKRDGLKRQLPSWQVQSAPGKRGANAALECEQNGIFILDIDCHDGETLDKNAVVESAKRQNCTLAALESASGRGLAILVAVSKELAAPWEFDEHIERKSDSVSAAQIIVFEGMSALLGVQIDQAAKNAERIRFQCPRLLWKRGDDDEITPYTTPDALDMIKSQLGILPAQEISTETKENNEAEAEKATAAIVKSVAEIIPGEPPKVREAAARLIAEAPKGGRRKQKLTEHLIFSCFEVGHSDEETAAATRKVLEIVGSSRLAGNEIERLVSDLRPKFTKKTEEAILHPDAPAKLSASERDRLTAERFFEGWRFDTFSGDVLRPDGSTVGIDDAAAECSRQQSPALPLRISEESLRALVIHNPERQFDGLKARVLALAADCTAADKGACARYSERLGLDSYEARRLQLWLYEIAGRALLPGEKTDCMLLISTHDEGRGKTMFFDAISKAFCGMKAAQPADISTKDTKILLSKSCIIALDEFDKIYKRVETSAIKSLLTESASCERAPYDRAPKTRLNRAVFAGTTNVENPLPPNENEGRRFWLIQPKTPMFFESTAEAEAMAREAARAVLDGIESAGGFDAIDENTQAGKIWIQTPQEAAETAKRNGLYRAADGPVLAILDTIQRLEKCPDCEGYAFPARRLATAIATGDLATIGGPCVQFTPVCRDAAAIARAIAARLSTQDRKKGRNRELGFTVAQLNAAFLSGEGLDNDEIKDLIDCPF